MIYLGCDPGMSGAIAVLNDDGQDQVYQMPKTIHEVLRLILTVKVAAHPGHKDPAWRLVHVVSGDVVALIELVSALPSTGRASAFKLGKWAGYLEAALAANNVRYREITPANWQRKMNCLTGGDKTITRRAALKLFPEVMTHYPKSKPKMAAPTNTTADALLMAELARRMHKAGEL